jgi:hypothetical protein
MQLAGSDGYRMVQDSLRAQLSQRQRSLEAELNTNKVFRLQGEVIGLRTAGGIIEDMIRQLNEVIEAKE